MAESNNLPVDDLQNEAEKMDMSFDIQTVSSCQRHIKVTIPAAEVKKYYNNEVDELVDKAIVPGFRVGKTPRKFVEKRFKKDIEERVKQQLLIDSLSQVSDSDEIVPISEPDIDVKAIVLPENFDGDFVYEYNIEVRPEFDVPNWKGLKIDRPVREFNDADIDKAITTIQNNYGTLVDKGEEAADGDYIVCKLTFSYEGKELSSADSETIRIRPTLSFHDGEIKDFDKLMTGVKPGDVRKAQAQLSDNTPKEELRGKAIDAEFEIKEVKELHLPDVDEEFIAEVGGFETMGDFRDAVLETLNRQLDYEQRKVARRQITETLTKDANWELPPVLLERQSVRELQRAILELRRSGYSESQIASQINFLRRNSQTQTAQALKEHFILERIADQENIKDEEMDYDMECSLIAAQSGVSPRRVRSQIEKAGNMDILRNQIIERKVIDLILGEAEFKEVPYEMPGEEKEEALDRPAGSDADAEIPEVSEEEAKEARRAEATEPKMKKD